MGRPSLEFLHGLSEEDRIFARQCTDKIRAAEERSRTGFTFFLSEGTAELAVRIMEAYSFDRYMLYGGYEAAERVMLGTFSPYDDPSESCFPIRAVTISYGRQATVTHRDILGSLMGLGIARDTVGDILVSGNESFVFLTAPAAGEVLRYLTKVGRAGVTVSEGFDPAKLPERSFADISGTVSSLRADCVLSLAARISRARAEELISSGLMTVKGHTVTKCSQTIAEGDTFSARGCGKFILGTIGGNTKKDRIIIVVKKYT